MKKIFLTVIVALLAVTTVSAQYKGDWGVGPKIGVYTNAGADGAIFGIGAAGQYSITDNWRVAPSILALCKTGCSVDISADVQYLFNIATQNNVLMNVMYAEDSFKTIVKYIKDNKTAYVVTGMPQTKNSILHRIWRKFAHVTFFTVDEAGTLHEVTDKSVYQKTASH